MYSFSNQRAMICLKLNHSDQHSFIFISYNSYCTIDLHLIFVLQLFELLLTIVGNSRLGKVWLIGSEHSLNLLFLLIVLYYPFNLICGLHNFTSIGCYG